jgi:hypothetical protein
MYGNMCVIKYGFIWCVICSPFFIWYGEDSDSVLVFFCGEAGPVYGFLCVLFVVRVGISIIKPFMFKGSSFRSK